MAVKRADRDQVENGQDDVDVDEGNEKGGRVRVQKGTTDDGEECGQEDVTYWSGNGDEGGVTTGGFEIGGKEFNRFAPAKADEKEGESSERVEVDERVQGKSTLRARSGITQAIGNESVREFMDGNGNDET